MKIDDSRIEAAHYYGLPLLTLSLKAFKARLDQERSEGKWDKIRKSPRNCRLSLLNLDLNSSPSSPGRW